MEKGKSFEPMLLERLDVPMGKKNHKSHLKQCTENNMRLIQNLKTSIEQLLEEKMRVSLPQSSKKFLGRTQNIITIKERNEELAFLETKSFSSSKAIIHKTTSKPETGRKCS